ncbi:DUF6644 family protein [Polymorphospora rubra]|uniref:DUF6644 domain-containing protein n=1 Tax=Polymorphospora rubra TaxID=338584 RepID=A0A810NAJ9_9ACTN|nr:DUF6644 family protein [Polymorphospora rubra]BCJ69424.1 hypothetical protein Prubr_64450 [Polymorphospora rubra]
MTEFLEWLQGSGLGQAVRGTPYLYAALESLHILGLAVLVGTAICFDLRLLGVGSRLIRVTTAATCLLRVSRFGFLITALTGIALFAGSAVAVAQTGAFPWKLALIGVAGLNVLFFHRGVYRRVDSWNTASTTPRRAHAAAVVSMLAWTATVFAGRFIAYT